MNNKSVINWIPDNIIKNCANCLISFGIITRKSHCRNCGKIYCKNCIQVVVINYNQTKLCISCYEKYNKNISDIINNEITIDNDTVYYEKIIEEKNKLINNLKNELKINFNKENLKTIEYYKESINEKNTLIDNLENQLTKKDYCDKYTQTDFSNEIINKYIELDESINIYDSANDIDHINNFNSDSDSDSVNDIETKSPNSVMISSTKDIVLQKKIERQKLLEDEYNKQVCHILNEKEKDKKYYNYSTLDV
jgi:hypothetical protein